MSRRTEAPPGMDCPHRHNCPHLEGMACCWLLECYQELLELRQQQEAIEDRYQQRIAELEKALGQRDQKIAQLRLEHRKHFKPSKAKANDPPQQVKAKRRGAPVGHPAWTRRPPDRIDATEQVPAPKVCPFCDCPDLLPSDELHEHVQEDIILVPRTRVTRYVHRQCLCPVCRRLVHATGEGELRNGQIGPLTRAVAMHLRYDLQIPYRKVQHILADLFGMPLVPATAMAFDRQATRLGRPIYEQLQAMVKSLPVAYADETSWRQDGRGHFLWYAGNQQIAVYQITPDRSAASAVKLLGDDFDGTLVSDDYAAYNATNPRHQQTCWQHLGSKADDIAQQIRLTDPPVKAPRSLAFCDKVQSFASHLCALGRKMRCRTLSLRKARAMVPALQRRLKRFAGQPLDHPAAETLRQRIIQKDKDKLFTFLRVKGVQPTNNHSEQSVRFLVIMRKICFGTRSPAGSESHSVLPSLLQTARRQGADAVQFLAKLVTRPLSAARAALFGNSS